MNVSTVWGKIYLGGGQGARRAASGAETVGSARKAASGAGSARRAASGAETAGSAGKVVSGVEAAGHGQESRISRRDSLESSADSGFCNVYSNYEGYGDPEAFGNSLRYRYSHTIAYTSTWFFEAAGNVLQKARGEEEAYDGVDVVNAYGFAYAERYEEIDKRYENSGEQWFDIDGTPLTKEKEREYLDQAYEAAVALQASSAKVMAGLRRQSGMLMPAVDGGGGAEAEELKNTFYRAKERYMDMREESRGTGVPMAFRRFSFGGNALLALLV